MQKCSLCGGKVVNGRCQDCGMPIPDEKRYTLRSETAHTHEVNGEKVLHRVRQAPGKKPVYTCPPERFGRQNASGRRDMDGGKNRKKSGAQVAWSVIAVIILFNVVSALITSCSA